MKDNRKIPLISDLSKPGINLQTMSGSIGVPTLSYIRMNNFNDAPGSSFQDLGTLIDDRKSTSDLEVVKGVASAGGKFERSTANLSDFEIYGQTVFNDVTLHGISHTVPMRQAGFNFPLESGVRKFLVRKNAEDINPAAAGGSGLTFMFKMKLGSSYTNKALLQIGDPASSLSSFCIGLDSSNAIKISFPGASGTSQQALTVPSSYTDKWITVFATPYINSSTSLPRLDLARVYAVDTGDLLVEKTTLDSSASGAAINLGSPHLYIGYGENTGGVNVAYQLSDFVSGVSIAEFAVADGRLTAQQMDFVARSHLSSNFYKSGFNSRAPKRTQQILDAQNSYPVSANPLTVPKASNPFNDTTTKVFGRQPTDLNVMFPEMLPAHMFSGSSEKIGAVGDSNKFYRDIHHTSYEKRITAPANISQGISHKETELLNLASRNSPITISQDTVALGGNTSPFNDNNPLADFTETVAVNQDVYPGLQQRMSDHVAIIIDLNPTEDSTVGVERRSDGTPTGRVTSIAYFNFDTKKWETQGKNNDFIVPGPPTIASASADPSGLYPQRTLNEIANSLGDALFDKVSVGFAGTSGFSILDPSNGNPLGHLKNRGMPTSNYGFPIHQKYEAKDSQLINMSDYISEPFLVERVSFEFGAAIEDSGPHSLGYIARKGTGNPRPTTQYKMMNGSGFDEFTSVTELPRYPFINGSWTRTISNINADCTSFSSSSAWPLYKILNNTGNSAGNRNAEFEGAIIPDGTFLKTSLGPRDNMGDQTGPWGYSGRKIDDGAAIVPASIIPVLAGGINGLVTGSFDKGQVGAGVVVDRIDQGPVTNGKQTSGPLLALQINRENAAADPHPASNFNDSTTGGTPFWRADTFFLMRQTKRIESQPTNINFKIASVYGALAFPLVPWLGANQENWMAGNNSWLGTPWDGSITAQGYVNSNRPFYGAQFLTSSQLVNGLTNISTSVTGSTTRELITFGQMAHYGYTNAADSYTDYIIDSAQIMSTPVGSGSHNTTLVSQLSDKGSSLFVPLYGQALKYARYPGFGFSPTPMDPTPTTELTSVTSDCPDTWQGMFSVNTEAVNNKYSGMRAIPSLTDNPNGIYADFGRGGANNNTKPGHSGRYILSGTANKQTAQTGKDHFTYTLDTFYSWPSRLDVADNTHVLGVLLDGSGLNDRYLAAAGSGFSAIATPAWPCNSGSNDDFYDSNSAFGVPDYSQIGTFKSPGSLTAQGWLDSGLGRDLNIEIGHNFKHAGTNIDFSDNWAGFTLMTASTISRPFTSPGRETAALPLRADVYKRQYLNYQTSFKLDLPVRVISPTQIEPPGKWTWTVPNPNTASTRWRIPEPSAGAYAQNMPNRSNDAWLEGTVPSMNARTAKRYHARGESMISFGGFNPGPEGGGVNSGRAFVKQVGASDIITQGGATGPLMVPGAPRLADGYNAPQYNINDNLSQLEDIQILSGSTPKNSTNDSLYILKPEDKLILGVQPSLPGWNAGSGLPNNRHATKYGIWDYSGSIASGKAVTHDLKAADGKATADSQMNMEDPYEPSHGLTMLAGPSRVVIFGTFLRNGKHYSPSSSQKLQSNNIHEALHFDNPVLDQYDVNSTAEYSPSYLTQLITGSILNVGDPRIDNVRGVNASIKDSNLEFSGSFQRFIRVAEKSQIFYDTLIQDPWEIARVAGLSSKSSAPQASLPWEIINLHMPHGFFVSQSAEILDATTEPFSATYAFSSDWASSFPFEQKYAGVKKLIARTPAELGGRQEQVIVNLTGPANDIGGEGNISVTAYGADIVISGSGERMWPGLEDTSFSFGTMNTGHSQFYGWTVMGISNMADTTLPASGFGSKNTDEVLAWAATGFKNKHKLETYRLLTAAIVGYGRNDGKQLDYMMTNEGFCVKDKSGSINGFVGNSLRRHPAGFKFGYMNSDHLSPSIIIRGDRYGQFRDMFEQRLYSKVYSKGDEYNKKGISESAVSCIFVDADGAPIDDASRTQCLNLSTEMTASKPFIEGESLRTLIINSEFVTVE